MTRLAKSDSQLDAEASAQPLEERDLDAAILLHRALYTADVWIPRLHVGRGGNGRSTSTWKDSPDPDPADAGGYGGIGWTGVEFTGHFARYLDGEYGQAFPWSKAMFALRHNCRVTHRPKHTDRVEWRGSLCAELVALVIRQDYSLDMARLRLGLPEEGKTRRTLDNALLFLERKLEDSYWRAQQQKPVERTPAEWMADVHVHVGLNGLHAVDCPQCRRAAA
jgi:hypothetical protein